MTTVFDAPAQSLEELFTKRELLMACYHYASQNSDDPSTQLGCLLLDRRGRAIAFGANQLPKGVDHTPERLERPTKLLVMEHAERNVIYAAARMGVATDGGTLYAPWHACADCARAIIAAGIVRVIGHQPYFDRTPDRWKASIEVGHQMMREAGVEMEFYDEPIGGVQSLCDGKVWNP
jgi:dCMP deaminase